MGTCAYANMEVHWATAANIPLTRVLVIMVILLGDLGLLLVQLASIPLNHTKM